MNQVIIFCAKYLFVFSLLIAGIYFIRQKRNIQVKMLVFGLLCAGISYLVALALGQLYFDPRPFVAGHFQPLIEHDTENGFPSDHTLLVSTVAGVVSIFNRRLSIWLWVITVIVGLARVYAGVHHFMDVIASAAIAILVTSLLYYIFKKRLLTGKTSA
ncbi:MAG: undecaprenyl-diphosphatase [Sediminibacterium sp.]